MDYPLVDPSEIRKRMDAIEGLVGDRFIRQDIQGLLVRVYDLEGLVGRITMGLPTPGI